MFLIFTVQAFLLLDIFLWTEFVLVRKKIFKILGFIFTGLTAPVIFITAVIYLFKREILGELDWVFIIFVFSGLLMMLMMGIKTHIFIVIYEKTKTRKKIVEEMKEAGEDVSLVDDKYPELKTERELFIFLGTMPIFLFGGAYFIAKIFQYVLFK